MRLDGRVALVTGAARGIGRAIALGLAREGSLVVANDVNLEQADKVVNEIKALGRKAIAVKADVRKSNEVNQMVETALKEFGRIDILVNNAGVTGATLGKKVPFWESTDDVWDAILDVNLKGVFTCCRAVIPHMIKNKRGKILSIASTAGMIGSITGATDYAGSKGGVIGFTKSLARDLGQYGINVNCVSPGPTETELYVAFPEADKERMRRAIPLGRLGKPGDIASMIVFLASDEASFITGQNYAVCGGQSL